MKAATKIIFFTDTGEKFFGEGPYRLLMAVEETGSLRAAALSMEMAYSKASQKRGSCSGLSADCPRRRGQGRRRKHPDT